MMEEYNHIAQNQNSKSAWLRLFPRISVHGNGELPWYCAEERWRVKGSCFDLLFFRREEDRGLNGKVEVTDRD
ncbi:hypothetical protein D8674_005184 [Pyrus ussuriensis x Pyrus communis]|uniref:Uncharacterized protein n=1 Tax=Pyrus ussuriensis x Pyrus communis TaxID=2448454 RepID=A0A5N5FRF7_9ROSA|nr:hypothetical protein D8674_005184 [Pyrus ussuriensis x Pyrus communis]